MKMVNFGPNCGIVCHQKATATGAESEIHSIFEWKKSWIGKSKKRFQIFWKNRGNLQITEGTAVQKSYPDARVRVTFCHQNAQFWTKLWHRFSSESDRYRCRIWDSFNFWMKKRRIESLKQKTLIFEFCTCSSQFLVRETCHFGPKRARLGR